MKLEGIGKLSDLFENFAEINPIILRKYAGNSFEIAENNAYIHRIFAEIMYIHQKKNWPKFTWDIGQILPLLGKVRHLQGRIFGHMNALGFKLRELTILDTLTMDVLKSSEIEGEQLDKEQVRSSIAKRLGLDIGGALQADRNVDGVVEMMMDATQQFDQPLTDARLYNWHAALFPTGRSGMVKITVGAWRTEEAGPMQVVSGPTHRQIVHFEAPEAVRLVKEMSGFLEWLNRAPETDDVLKAAIAHLWFLTIHPFDDGNGRIARAITDTLLARADGSPQRFYSMSAQILLERKEYYNLLESTQKGDLDITEWLNWFLACLLRSMEQTENVLKAVMERDQFWDQHRETEINSRQHKMLTELLDGFFGKLTSSKWATMTKTSPDTALRDIQDLIEKGILEKEEGGGRNTNYKLVLCGKKLW